MGSETKPFLRLATDSSNILRERAENRLSRSFALQGNRLSRSFALQGNRLSRSFALQRRDSDPYPELQVAVVEGLFLGQVRRGEGLLVGLVEGGRLVVRVGLPEDHADLVVGEVGGAEHLHPVVRPAVFPALPIALLDPLAVPLGDAVALVAEGLRLLLELLARVDEHHPAAVARRLLVAQQPDAGEGAHSVTTSLPVAGQARAQTRRCCG
jgi:hypothetical protein